MPQTYNLASFAGRRPIPAVRLWPILCLVSLLALIHPALANADGDDPGYWVGNFEWQATRSKLDTAAISSGAAEVFDSSDYQYMLIFGVAWKTCFCLDLASGDVIRYPLSDVLLESGEMVSPAGDGELMEMFTFHDDGRISFIDESHQYDIEPAPPLVGEISLETLNRRMPVYSRRAAAYTPQPAFVKELANLSTPIELIAFFGSWCQLCKHHLPGILSTVAAAANPNITLTLIAMDENVSVPAEWIDEYAVGATPTVIVVSGGVELDRIEEEPLPSAEEALVQIIAMR
jgi:Thioredoxin